MKDLIKKLGGETNAKECSVDPLSAGPLFDPDVCTYLSSPDQFQCLDKLNSDPPTENSKRLCYCQFLKGV